LLALWNQVYLNDVQYLLWLSEAIAVTLVLCLLTVFIAVLSPVL